MTPRALLQLRQRHREEAWQHLFSVARSSWRKQLAKKHPLLFGRVYLPGWMTYETPEFHWRILDAFMREARYAVAAPVGSAKTTTCTKLGNIWSAFCEPVEELLIVTSAGKLAGMWLEQMGHALETNDMLKEDFGEFKGVHWGSEHLELVFPHRRCFIRGIGRGEATRGRRPDRITIDDPEDEQSLKSPLQREEFRDWFRTALINRLD